MRSALTLAAPRCCPVSSTSKRARSWLGQEAHPGERRTRRIDDPADRHHRQFDQRGWADQERPGARHRRRHRRAGGQDARRFARRSELESSHRRFTNGETPHRALRHAGGPPQRRPDRGDGRSGLRRGRRLSRFPLRFRWHGDRWGNRARWRGCRRRHRLRRRDRSPRDRRKRPIMRLRWPGTSKRTPRERRSRGH